MRHTQRALILIPLVICCVQSAKILGIFPIPSVSHQVVFQPIWKELSLRGHQVTVITPNPLKDPSLTNLTEIDVSYMYDMFRKLDSAFAAGPTSQSHWSMVKMFVHITSMFTDPVLSHKEVSALINDTSKSFDLVIAEYLWTYPSAFSYRFKCPLIGVASLQFFAEVYEVTGNPVHPILYPQIGLRYADNLSFFERMDAALYTIYFRYLYRTAILPESDGFVKKYFGNDMPYLGELEKNVSMLFLNTNPVIHKARPYLPNVIEMGRMHIKPKKPLPNDLQEFLDSANEGVIYFSLGSNVKSTHIDPVKRKFIMEVFAELPYKVLWKFEDDYMEGKPGNVKISKWLPQQDLLGHPNIKLFITQGGLQSTEEAIVNNVPLIGIPFMGDQFYNAKRYVTLGIGLQLNFGDLSKESFKKAILEVILNSRYKKKITEISKVLTDEPESGLQRAVWWTEYVIRHKGAPYFRSPALDMPFYQYYLLDVVGFFLAIIFLFAYTIYRLFKYTKNMFTVYKAANKKRKIL